MARSGGLLGDPRGLDNARPRTWRRRLIRLVSLGVVVYAANALLGLAEPALSSGQIRGVSSSGDPDCVRGGVQCDAKPARPTIDAVALRLPDPDPSSGKSRYYSANHWFHVSEFHARNHARLRSIDALPPLRTLALLSQPLLDRLGSRRDDPHLFSIHLALNRLVRVESRGDVAAEPPAGSVARGEVDL